MLRAVRELAIVAGLWLVYDTGRVVVEGRESVARHHAVWMHEFERVLHLPSEARLQGVVAGIPHVFEVADRYYVSVHFPLMILFLVWGFVARPREDYAWARNLLIVQTFLALAIQLLFPLAPPRMFPQWGFVDTGLLLGLSPYRGSAGDAANQFAAMPSLHIGWAVLIAVVLARTGPRVLAALGWTNAVVTTLVVVVTANHWWLDGVAAVALLGVAIVVFPGPGRSRIPARPGRT